MDCKMATGLVSLVLPCSVLAGPNYADPALINDIEKIEVTGRRNQAYSEPTEQTEKMLAIAGLDGDPLSAVFSLPGVVYAGGDDGGEPAIRGSSPDDNAFYIDGLPVDYIFHMFGDSIFNQNLVRDFRLDPAGFDASYGNAIGGIFDVSLRDPRNQDIQTTIDMSMLKASAMIEGGITENTAFYASYRRSLIQLFLSEGDELDDDVKVYQAPESSDYQSKFQWLLGDKHKLTFSLNGAQDSGGINISAQSEFGRVNPDVVGDASINAKFDSASLQWQYFGDNQNYFNLVGGYVKSSENEKVGAGQFIKYDSNKLMMRAFYQHRISAQHLINVGADIIQQDADYSFDLIPYFCTEHTTSCEDQKGERIQDVATLKDTDSGLYISDIWTLTNDITAEIGIRAEHNDYTEQQFFHPRLSVQWQATDDLLLTTKAGSYSRFPDADKAVKKLGNPKLKSPESHHVSVKADYAIDTEWKTSLEVYYKTIDELALATNIDDDNAQPYINELSGKAVGVEWGLEKSLTDNWYGWASLSWSKSDRTDERTNITKDYYLDTPIIVNVVANYQLNERWNLSARLTGRSGAKYTPIVGIKPNPDYPDHFIPEYGQLNSDTLPVYHRLDLQAVYSTQAWGQDAQWTFALLNATGSDNISGYYFAPDGNETIDNYNIEGEEGMSMFPSIGFKMSF